MDRLTEIERRLSAIERMLGVGNEPHLGMPVIPLHQMRPTTNRCPDCLRELKGADGYVCLNQRCPVSPPATA